MARPIICSSMAEAVADIPDGIQLLVPGFGPGTPHNLLTALFYTSVKDIHAVVNGVGFPSAATDGRKSLGDIIAAGRVRKVTAAFTAPTHPSQQSIAAEMIRTGKMEAELVPQGTLAERVRAGGAGIPAFYTPAGVGTLTATGKEHRDFNGRTYVMEEAIFADYAFIRAWKADTAGNLIFRLAARNFNPIFAMGARHTIVEVEQPIVEAGELPPDQIHTPGVVIEKLVQIPPDGYFRDVPRT
ncbi:MAG: CoA transferase subunit A [Dehalococcoidia bacterium]